MEISCKRCGTKLDVDSSLVGQEVRCPKCEFPFEVQETVANSGDSPGAATSHTLSGAADSTSENSADHITTPSRSTLFLQIPEGSIYGPVERKTLDNWVRQGRVSSDCRLRYASEDSWYSSLVDYPMLQEAGNPFAAGTLSAPRQRFQPHRGNLIFGLSILGCIIPFLSIWPAVIGTRDLQLMRTGKRDPAGAVLTRAGQAIAMVSSMIWIGAFAVALLAALIHVMNSFQ